MSFNDKDGQTFFLGNADIATIDAMYKQYMSDASALDSTWQHFFEGFEFARTNFEEGAASPVVGKEFNVISLINAYRKNGHLFTKTNPVRERRHYTPTLDIENFGLAAADLETSFEAGKLIGIGNAKLKDIIEHLKHTYCDSIGVEYMYIRNPEIVEWLRSRLEDTKNRTQFNADQKKQIYQKLSEAVLFESFLDTKFVGQKRFSVEGGESLIPALDVIIEKGAEAGVEEIVVGMAHRGRLNTLANIFEKDCAEIFSEFEGKDYDDQEFSGDVKYHLGHHTTREVGGRKVNMTLSPNPSHLEAVDPVVEGMARAKADLLLNNDYKRLLPILVHGDAAIAGQGVVYEVIQMAFLDGYKTGGTIHIVVNNQVGFTTNYTDARSSTYCTDIAKVTLSPVFHVNGDDIEAVVHVTKLAMEYRQTFGRDVFIDLLGYRKYGHNEGDEPRFTQPVLYKAIEKHPNPRKIYEGQLTTEGVIDAAYAKQVEVAYKEKLQQQLDRSKEITKNVIKPFLSNDWKDLRLATQEDFEQSPETGAKKADIQKVLEKIAEVPEGKKFFKKIQKLLEDRRKAVFEDDKFDWGTAELLAYGTLALEGYNVRMSGQDVERGTFSHRHAVIKIEDTEDEYVPLQNLSDKQGKVEFYNSHLSEYGVLGFDYGYAFAAPNTLTIWEAQFGDFNNGAQIIIDQFISAAEDKWWAMNGLVMLLPHGYEGQGAEHSSARMERYLTMCAENNMQVVNCTTPANFFHALRRQLKRDFRKPLIVFTPKSLLRHPKCISTQAELVKGSFRKY
ncbi:MAG: 2-oxoglutarate dehydrogenase E1 component [Sphingobacteriales bacterium JAD_PAG50586_3]|nr:MAG: 2-oxoglutarate dehydrogenase E1 component [Sphingobacteriales bacterium JAD_PAG50586_3]